MVLCFVSTPVPHPMQFLVSISGKHVRYLFSGMHIDPQVRGVSGHAEVHKMAFPLLNLFGPDVQRSVSLNVWFSGTTWHSQIDSPDVNSPIPKHIDHSRGGMAPVAGNSISAPPSIWAPCYLALEVDRNRQNMRPDKGGGGAGCNELRYIHNPDCSSCSANCAGMQGMLTECSLAPNTASISLNTS